jgi:hypothetical protein
MGIKPGTIDTEPGFFGGDGEGGCTRDPTDVVRWSGPSHLGWPPGIGEDQFCIETWEG